MGDRIDPRRGKIQVSGPAGQRVTRIGARASDGSGRKRPGRTLPSRGGGGGGVGGEPGRRPPAGRERAITMVNTHETVASTGPDSSHDGEPGRLPPAAMRPAANKPAARP